MLLHVSMMHIVIFFFCIGMHRAMQRPWTTSWKTVPKPWRPNTVFYCEFGDFSLYVVKQDETKMFLLSSDLNTRFQLYFQWHFVKLPCFMYFNIIYYLMWMMFIKGKASRFSTCVSGKMLSLCVIFVPYFMKAANKSITVCIVFMQKVIEVIYHTWLAKWMILLLGYSEWVSMVVIL